MRYIALCGRSRSLGVLCAPLRSPPLSGGDIARGCTRGGGRSLQGAGCTLADKPRAPPAFGCALFVVSLGVASSVFFISLIF